MTAQKRLEEMLRNEDSEVWIEPTINPFLASSGDLGKAELVAAGTNVLGTYAATFATQNPLLLGLFGPIAEKAGFVLWEGWKAYNSWKEDRSQGPLKLLVEGIKGGGANLAADIAFHDPSYVGITASLIHFAEMNPVLASAMGFLSAIPVAAFGKNRTEELAHKGLKKLSIAHGYTWESYYEARFVPLSETDPEKLFNDLREAFNLEIFNVSEYSDIYYEHAMPVFGNRLGLVRRRKVVDLVGNKHSYDDLELSYTIAKKIVPVAGDFNLFYSHKEKAWKNTTNHRDLPLGLGRLVRDTDIRVRFDRTMAHNEDIRIAMDEVMVGDEKFHILEIKAYEESGDFFRAMQYALRHFPLMTTNHPKMRVVQSLT